MAARHLVHAARFSAPHFKCRSVYPFLRVLPMSHASYATVLPKPSTTSSQGQSSSGPLPVAGRRVRPERADYELALALSQDQPAQVDQADHDHAMRTSPLPSLLKHMSLSDSSLSPLSSSRIPSTDAPGRAPSGGERGHDMQAEVIPSSATETVNVHDGPAHSAPSEGIHEGSSRRNPVGVQLLSAQLHKQLFPGEALPQPPESLLQISKQHLGDNGLSPDGAAMLPEISFDLPALEGDNIRQHFHTIGRHTSEPYFTMAKNFADVELPPMPESWDATTPGWIRYERDGTTTPVDNLDGETVVTFDVETLYKVSKYPVMATAATPNAWYSWLSPSIFLEPPETEPEQPRPDWDKSVPEYQPRTLIPLFSPANPDPRIVVGHNVSYDRARVVEEYSLDRTSTRWLDTLSLHVATRGITSVQRAAWTKYRKNKQVKAALTEDTLDVLTEEAENNGDALLAESLKDFNLDGEEENGFNTWQEVTSVNSLADVAALHCGMSIDKSIRDRFGDDSIRHPSQLRGELEDLLAYCATDVETTHKVYQKVLPLFLNSCPHPVSFAGVLTMGNSFLPVNETWKDYIRNADETYKKMIDQVRLALRHLADKLRLQGPTEGDPWTSQLDWTPKAARWADGQFSTGGEVATEGLKPGNTPVNTPAKSNRKAKDHHPAWYKKIAKDPEELVSKRSQRHILPFIMQLAYKGYPVYFLEDHWWCFKAPVEAIPDLTTQHGPPVELSEGDSKFLDESSAYFRMSSPGKPRYSKLSGTKVGKDIQRGLLTSPYASLLQEFVSPNWFDKQFLAELQKCADDMLQAGPESSDWARQLEWRGHDSSGKLESAELPTSSTSTARMSPKARAAAFGTWPKWYFDLTAAPSNTKLAQGELDLTTRKTITPLLLRMQWYGYPLVYSKEHRWTFRVPKDKFEEDAVKGGDLSKLKPIVFSSPPKQGDEAYAADEENLYFGIPHKDGEGAKVGNPLAKAFQKAIENGTLSSALAGDEDQEVATAAKEAISINALCSYWMSSRERIMDQFVVYEDREETKGMIIPQMITMGTVTRRAVESTWLTASNAKKNRVGSELKAMVRAPPGYAIVGADVDSEELWISSVMGDSQFGTHGATAIGWMTLEGTKSAGTDLHSKTANILNISRDAAKVFNYSRIYGAGKPHAIQLLLQGDGQLTKETADELATNLYKQTKGAKTFRNRRLPMAANAYLWHGGSESYLFNTLEAIALMDRPTTPALGCGVTRALRKGFLDAGHSYLPSRINWVVQSSGVDYLHLLISSMEYLIEKYAIKARYLLSVHDEVRYLAAEDDKLRTAMALQIANAWTRALFCYNLGLDDMPQGIAFFSAVDIDHILRKETDMTCVTPSHPTALPPGESLDITQLLQRTGGSLGAPAPGKEAPLPRVPDPGRPVAIFEDIRSDAHERYLRAQAAKTASGARNWLDTQPSVWQKERKGSGGGGGSGGSGDSEGNGDTGRNRGYAETEIDSHAFGTDIPATPPPPKSVLKARTGPPEIYSPIYANSHRTSANAWSDAELQEAYMTARPA